MTSRAWDRAIERANREAPEWYITRRFHEGSNIPLAGSSSLNSKTWDAEDRWPPMRAVGYTEAEAKRVRSWCEGAEQEARERRARGREARETAARLAWIAQQTGAGR